MGTVGKLAGTLALLGAFYIYNKLNRIPPIPNVEEKWWGPGSAHTEDTAIRPFKINVPDEVIRDLNDRLNRAIPFHPPLEDVNQHYGMNTKLLTKIVDYWKTKYNWKQRQEFLNQFPQFQTNIQGLKIHFLHVKPKNVPQGVEVLPLLLLHGWPGSVREFYEMIPILTTPQKGSNFVFEVIAPSLPGYGFSDGAVRPGLGPTEMAQLFNKLMIRLKLNRYYVQGGDWGSIIALSMTIVYPDHVIAVHRNLCSINNWFSLKTYIGAYFPSLFFTEKETERNYPLSKQINYILLEFGYVHLQATKPDTVGVALRDSPVGLAAYILEKFVTWTNPEWKDLEDAGGLTKKFTMNQLLDNIMIYWVTRSITTSVRIYSEYFNPRSLEMGIDQIPFKIPSGCNRFKNEISYPTEAFLRETNLQLIHLTDYEDGGHFAAFELPEVLAKDIFEFAQKVRSLPPKKEL